MGEMVMKKLFSKDNFLFPTFNNRQSKQSIFVSISIAILFVLSSFLFLHALYGFVNAIGSFVSGSTDVMIKDLLRILPLIVCFLMTLWTMFLFHALHRNVNDERREKSLKKNSIVIASFGAFNIVYIIVCLIVGKFSSIVEGSPFPIYPLDTLLYSLLFIAIACFVFFYSKKLAEKIPYVVPSRGPIVTKARFFYCFGMAIWMLVALYSFAGFTHGLFIIDFRHGYQAFSIALLFMFLVNVVFIVFWEFYYNELKVEARKQLLLPLAICGTCLSLISTIFYFVALGLNLDGPANVGFGVLPVTFAASVNIATLILVFAPVIVSIIALIKGFLIRKK